jgi:hypothetical protein
MHVPISFYLGGKKRIDPLDLDVDGRVGLA